MSLLQRGLLYLIELDLIKVNTSLRATALGFGGEAISFLYNLVTLQA